MLCILSSVGHGHSTLDFSCVVAVGRNEEKVLVQVNRHVDKIEGLAMCLGIMIGNKKRRERVINRTLKEGFLGVSSN